METIFTKSGRRHWEAARLLSWATRCMLLLACFFIVLAAVPVTASAQVVISVGFAPPILPVYVQPICPTPGWIWTPGYWAYNEEGGYYWVPGTWVEPPQVGVYWTPGYWGWSGGFYGWHGGYWGPTVGFYGGVNYGFGYTGIGFAGGEWRGGAYYYNRSVSNVNVTNVTNVYNKTVIVNNTTVNNVSYNGGTGGTTVHPTPEQEKYAQAQHIQPTPVQIQHQTEAAKNPQLRAAVNGGKPPIAATAKPGEFKGPGVVAAKPVGPKYTPPKPSGATAAHPTGTTPAAHPSSASVPKPPTASSSPHTESTTHPASVPHPPTTPKTETAPHSTPKEPIEMQGEPKPKATPPPSHPASTPHPSTAPHTESAPHAAPPPQHAAPPPPAPQHAAPPPSHPAPPPKSAPPPHEEKK